MSEKIPIPSPRSAFLKSNASTLCGSFENSPRSTSSNIRRVGSFPSERGFFVPIVGTPPSDAQRKVCRSPDDTLLQTVATTLKKLYSSKEPWKKPWPWLPNNSSINSEDSFTEFEVGELNRAGRFVRQNDYMLDDIFKSYKPSDEPPTKILLQGEAGFGKTTICTKMAYDWATKTNSYCSHFQLLIFFRLRNLQCGKLEDIILALITKTCQVNGDEGVIQQKLRQTLRGLGSKLLLILDGLDELPGTAERAAVERVIKIHKGGEPHSFLGCATVLVTSRPCQPSNVVKSFQQYLNIKGFSPRQQEEYINTNFSDSLSKAKLLKIELLRPSGNLYGLGRCPLMLYLICFLHERNELGDFKRKTEVFMAVLRFLAERCADNMEGVEIEDKESLASEVPNKLPFYSIFVRLGFVCLTALTVRRLHIKEQEIVQVFPEENERAIALNLGILKRVSMFFRMSDDIIYETVYKSLMEFLAALYLESVFSGHNEQEGQQIQIEDIFVRCDPQTLYQMVIFLCGLMGPRAHCVIRMLTIPEITGPSGLAIIPLDLNVIVPDNLQNAYLRVAFIAVLLNECGSSDENVAALLERVSRDDRLEHSAAHLSSMFWRGYTDLLRNQKRKIHRISYVFHSASATSYHNLLLQHITMSLRESYAVEGLQIAWVADGQPSDEPNMTECEYQALVIDTLCAASFSNPRIQTLILDVPQCLLYRFVRLLRTACPKGHFRKIRFFGRYGHEDFQRLIQELESSQLHEKFNTLDIGFTLTSGSSFTSLLNTLIGCLTNRMFNELVVCDLRREAVIVCTERSQWKPVFEVTTYQEQLKVSSMRDQSLKKALTICLQTLLPADHDMLFELRMQKQEGRERPFRLFLGIKNCLGTWKDFVQQGATVSGLCSEIHFKISQIITFCSQDVDQTTPCTCDVSRRMKRELASCLGINSIYGISTFFRYPALLS